MKLLRLVLPWEGARERTLRVWRDLLASLWLRPMLWMLGLSALALLLSWLERTRPLLHLVKDLPWFLQVTAGPAREILSSIAGAMLTVSSLAFSLVMVALVQAATVYSPRILRTFLGDTHNQHVLGILLGTFLFNLLVLRGISTYAPEAQVPLLGAHSALLLSLLAIGALISLIHNVTRSIKVDVVLGRLRRRAYGASRSPELLGVAQDPAGWSPPASLARHEIPALRSGYVQALALEPIYKLACQRDLVVELLVSAGDFVLRGAPVLVVYGDPDPAVFKRIAQALVLGHERVHDHDPDFAAQQLVDIALRALSPGINDPSTAVDALHSLGEVLLERARHGDRIARLRSDLEGHPRLLWPEQGFAPCLERSLSQLIHYGHQAPEFMRHLVRLLGMLGRAVPHDAQRREVKRALEQAREAFSQAAHHAPGQARFEQAWRQAHGAL